MAIGKSGRVVIETDPLFKEKLHEAVKKEGMSLKEWFEKKAQEDFPFLINLKEDKNLKV
ncbi:hypothetical protein Q4493_11220 [Colwellia sp. 1_MG-2023]|uniref:hypothetical protein n=1 Tax=Colwellia sp. 1_MG-2023 TaxID=3062649 RepID=UPI0026E11F50|nr:hypothetical protein [Colwellia sp. 1_MG-2023]MDO6446343.1 hypothetical protein [Colwellia sp. 1_MG-2023]